MNLFSIYLFVSNLKTPKWQKTWFFLSIKIIACRTLWKKKQVSSYRVFKAETSWISQTRYRNVNSELIFESLEAIISVKTLWILAKSFVFFLKSLREELLMLSIWDQKFEVWHIKMAELTGTPNPSVVPSLSESPEHVSLGDDVSEDQESRYKLHIDHCKNSKTSSRCRKC